MDSRPRVERNIKPSKTWAVVSRQRRVGHVVALPMITGVTWFEMGQDRLVRVAKMVCMVIQMGHCRLGGRAEKI